MFSIKQRQGPSSFYTRLSQPKPISQQAVSTRCISVTKPESKPLSLNTPSVLKSSQQSKPLTYFLGKGNNEGVIKRVLQTRSKWVHSEDSSSAFINLKWQQDQRGFNYSRLVDSKMCRTVFNQFQFHEALSNKEFLFKNLEQYCNKHNLDLWKIVPPTFILNVRDQCNMDFLKQFTYSYEHNYPANLKQKNGAQTEVEIKQNKFNLKRIFANSNLKRQLPKPPSIPSEFLDEDGEYLWIVKPTFLNRGRGIQVFSRLETLVKYVSDNIQGYVQKSLVVKQDNESPPPRIDYIKRNSEQIQQSVLLRDPANREVREKREEVYFDGNQYIRVIPRGPAIIRTDRFLIQKYLEKPMLIKNRKFDIRIWVLVTQNLMGYVFQQGYVRLSSLEYSCTDSPENNTFMHLTNNAVQKFSEGYGEVADGNQLSFKHLKEEMELLGLNFDECIEEIHEHIRVTLKATLHLLNRQNRKFSFQIFGYDFMIDRVGHPWLIEVNTNPCLQQSSKLLGTLIPRMVNDAFKLTVDYLFWGSVSSATFPVQGYDNNKSMWKYLEKASA